MNCKKEIFFLSKAYAEPFNIDKNGFFFIFINPLLLLKIHSNSLYSDYPIYPIT